MEYRVREFEGKHYPERYDPDMGWVGYKHHEDFLGFDIEEDAWVHIKENPHQLNVNCD